jgi:predicted nucleic acid-binding protein
MAKPSSPADAKHVRAMVDATVLFAGIGWPRWSYEILRHATKGDFHLVLAPSVITQSRRNLVKKLPHFAQALEDWLLLGAFELATEPTVKEIEANHTLVRQIEDVPIALAAIHAKVDCFISEDKDFTALDATTAELRKRLKVMRPVIFLREVMGWSSEDLETVHHRGWPIKEQ